MSDVMILVIIVVVAVAAFIGLASGGSKDKKPSAYKDTPNKNKEQTYTRKSKEQFYDEQNERVSVGGYKKKAVLNRTEQISRKAIYNALYKQEKQKTYQLFAQINLGEMLSHQNNKLYKDINSKRVDFVLIDNKYLPFMVIEIHGQGHYSEEATKRDIIKRKAIESAGIKYLAVAVGNDEAEIKTAVFDAVTNALREL